MNPKPLHNGLTPAERERYEAQPGLAPELRPPGQPGGVEPIGAILARLKALQAGGKPMAVPTHLALVPAMPGQKRIAKRLPDPELVKAENAAAIERGRERAAGRPRDWLRDSPVQGYPGQFMEESAKEASD